MHAIPGFLHNLTTGLKRTREISRQMRTYNGLPAEAYCTSRSMAGVKLPFVAVLVVLWSLSPDHVNAECNTDTGPSGALDCFLDTINYDGYQWATCLSNEDIKNKSKGGQSCRNTSATYCYNQCMIEVYGLDRGNITADCACSPSATLVPPTGSTLPQDCYSPSGTDCDWFKSCLEKKYQCSRGPNSNGVAFAESFCRMYEQRSYLFSGRTWVDAVRKCFQLRMTPLMWPFANNSCDEVKRRSYRSQFACYKTPYVNVQSVCNVTSVDFWQMFWILRSYFISSYSEALLGLLKVSKTCTGANRRVDEMHQDMRKIVVKLKIRIKSQTIRKRRAADSDFVPTEVEGHHWDESQANSPEKSERDLRPRYKRDASVDDKDWEGESDNETAIHRLAAELGDLLARQQGWNVSGVQWFTYGLQTNDEQIQAFVLLADAGAFSINRTSSSPNMTVVVQRAAQAFQSGDVVVVSLGGEPVELQTMNACGDIDCQNVYLNVTHYSKNCVLEVSDTQQNPSKIQCFRRSFHVIVKSISSG